MWRDFDSMDLGVTNTPGRAGFAVLRGVRVWAATCLVLAIVTLAGCGARLPAGFEQSLEIFSAKKVDFSEIEYYAVRSRSAYDPIEGIRKTYPLVTRAATVQPVDVRYFIETDPERHVQTLSIRGTAVKPNLWEDLETALIPDTILGIPLHRGFQKDATALYQDAVPYLRKDMPIRITGHSLGGAVAVILAAYLDRQGYRVERVVTFGQPKVSSQAPSQYVVSVMLRVVNDRDVVPTVPPYSPARHYQHFAPEVILREGRQYVYLDLHDADRLSVGDFWRNITHLSTREHHMDGYLSNIQTKISSGARQTAYLLKEEPDT